jgi:hypothetical protein
MWYLHSHFTCDKLFQSLTPISFPTYPFGALGEEIIPLLTGKAYQVRTSKAGGLTSLIIPDHTFLAKRFDHQTGHFFLGFD